MLCVVKCNTAVRVCTYVHVYERTVGLFGVLLLPLVQGSCTFEFLPLKVGETVGKLTLNAAELGVYQYELRLKATAPPPEKAVHFMTTLGSNVSHSCKFVSFAKGRTEYSCKVGIRHLCRRN